MVAKQDEERERMPTLLLGRVVRALMKAERGRAIAIGKAKTEREKREVIQRYNARIQACRAAVAEAEQAYYALKEREANENHRD